MNANDWANVVLFLIIVAAVLATSLVLDWLDNAEQRAVRRLSKIRRGVEQANMHEGIRRTYGLNEYALVIRHAPAESRLERTAYRRTALGHATHRHPSSRPAYRISRPAARIGGDERD